MKPKGSAGASAVTCGGPVCSRDLHREISKRAVNGQVGEQTMRRTSWHERCMHGYLCRYVDVYHVTDVIQDIRTYRRAHVPIQ